MAASKLKSKYDERTETLRRSIGAHALFLLVFGDEESSGMSFVASDEVYPAVRAHLPGMLRDIADKIEEDNKPNGNTN